MSGTTAQRRERTVAANQRRYRDLMSAFPTGVAVVTSVDAEGSPRGMTCSSLTSVTLEPPTLLVCLRRGSATLDAVNTHGGFAVNLLHADAQHTAELFAGSDPDRFARVYWRRSPSGLPHLTDDAIAVADCRVAGLFDVGDHTIVLGQVGGISRSDGRPLLYGLRRFAAWPHP
ncbi:flavin reductase family protein [Streptomyces violascens]|uniref:flavin reductase family protein n=1 Tax=Streptomyces violascens TaxID=67381 RepID=UPI003654F7B5